MWNVAGHVTGIYIYIYIYGGMLRVVLEYTHGEHGVWSLYEHMMYGHCSKYSIIFDGLIKSQHFIKILPCEHDEQ